MAQWSFSMQHLSFLLQCPLCDSEQEDRSADSKGKLMDPLSTSLGREDTTEEKLYTTCLRVYECACIPTLSAAFQVRSNFSQFFLSEVNTICALKKSDKSKLCACVTVKFLCALTSKIVIINTHTQRHVTFC